MNCQKHPKKDASKVCVGCGNFFCEDCLTQVKGKNYCNDCLSGLAEEKMSESEATKKEEKPATQIIINQQQQQQQQQTISGEKKKPRGNWCILCILIVVFWPAAIVYALIRSWRD